MKRKDLRQSLVDHYGGESMRSERAERLKRMASGRAAAGKSPLRDHSWKPVYNVAACLAIVSLIVVYATTVYRPTAAHQAAPAVTQAPPADSTTPSVWTAAAMRPETVKTASAPNLVAVNLHADWCTRCREVGPVFRALAGQYGDRDVLFVNWDVTDEKRRRQAEMMAAELDIQWAADQTFQTGMAKLIDRKHKKVLATIVNREQAAEMAAALTIALSASD